MPTAIRNYIFGNSLVNHLSSTSETTVPYWMHQFATAGGNSYAVDGQWGFLRTFADNLPPLANWGFSGVPGAWNSDNQAFGDANFNAVMINPANFIQDQAPNAAYAGDNPNGASPVSATLQVIDWVQTQEPGTKMYIYEGWADMAGLLGDAFPPSSAGFSQYNTFVRGEYHDWYVDYVAQLSSARPGVEIELVPTASIIARILSETDLRNIPITDLYVDGAPHGTSTIYFLAAMTTYSAMYGEAVPADYSIPSSVHPLVAQNFSQIIDIVWEEVGSGTGGGGGTTNTAPDANNDTATTDEDEAVVINVRANDTDADGDSLTISDVQNPANGTVSIQNGNLLYTPNSGFSGSDQFDYTVSDGNGGTSTARVTVTVNEATPPPPGNTNPNARNDTATTDQDQSVLINVRANDTDADGDSLTIASVGDASNGSVAIQNGQVRYTPNSGYSGNDSFTYRVSDGNGGSNQATVNVTVNASTGGGGNGGGGGTGGGSGTLTNPSMGVGLNGIADWSTQQPFINMMLSAREWLGHITGQWGGWDADRLENGGYLDANGWPTSIPAGLDRVEALMLTDMPAEATSLAGRYRVTYEGEGNIQISGRATNIQYSDGEIWFDYQPGPGLVGVVINSTDPNNNGNYIRNIEMVHQDNIEAYENGAIFNPDWTALIEDMRSLRFMDWQFTNGSDIVEWSDRPQPGDYSYTRAGSPVETMVALANELGVDPWFNIPHQATDEYIRNFATYVRDNLDPSLRAYVEYSNEVWNYTFPQAQWAQQQAEARWGANAAPDAWLQFVGMRSAQAASIWDEVFGAQSDARVSFTIATHTGWPGLEDGLFNAPLWVAEDPANNRPPVQSMDSYAVTGYFGYELGTDERAPEVLQWIAQSRSAAESAATAQGLTGAARTQYIQDHQYDQAVARAAQDLRAGSLNELINTTFPYHAGVAQANGLDLVMYEGGTHVTGIGSWANNAELTAFFSHFNYSDTMGELYQELLAGWRAAGGTLFNAFVDVAIDSQWGSWGALRHLDDDTSRWDALIEFNENNPGWWETRDPGTFTGGGTTPPPNPDEVMVGDNGDNTLDGGDGNDQIDGRGGNDELRGGTGDDTIEGGSGNDMIYGGAGTDLAVFGDGDTVVDLTKRDEVQSTGHGNDTIRSIENVRTGDGNDFITGHSAANLLQGNGGNDYIFGRGGDDTIEGGAGDDYLQGGDGNDRLDGGAGANDFVDYTYALSGVRLDLSDGTATVGSDADTLSGLEHVVGSSFDDQITGNADGNILIGGEGNDTLRGAGGNDTVIGGVGLDVIFGGTGQDVLDAGATGEGDRMTGGSGADIFLIRGGNYVVEDFADDDLLVVEGGPTGGFGGLTITASGSSAVVSFGSTQLTLLNTATGDLTFDDFVFV